MSPAQLRMHLIDGDVEGLVPSGLLESLGCQRLGARHLLQLLETYLSSPVVEVCGAELWWRGFLALLDDLLDADCDEELLLPAFRRLAFVPVVGGINGMAACADGLCLPPETGLVGAFPQPLLATMRMVRPGLLETVGDGLGSEDDIVSARARRAMRRLGVAPLTLRRVFMDVASPAFARAASVAVASDLPLPAVVATTELGQPPDVLQAIAELLLSHWEELRPELEGSPVAWPLTSAGVGSVSVGVPRLSVPLHLPSLRLDEVLEGSSVTPCYPILPTGGRVVGEAAKLLLRHAGLALPVLRIQGDDAGDWTCPEFDRLLHMAVGRSPDGSLKSSEVARLTSLALAFDEHWSSSYEEFSFKRSGGREDRSSFLRALRTCAWLPSDADGSLHAPAALCLRTASIVAAFPDDAADDLPWCAANLRNKAFCKALGLRREADAALATSLLRRWAHRRCAGAGPTGSAAAYALVEAEACAEVLRGFTSIVVGRGEALLDPSACVWDDNDAGCCSVSNSGSGPRALAPLYGPRWRRFFVDGLGVRVEPSLEQCAMALDRLAVEVGLAVDGEGNSTSCCEGGAGSAGRLHRLLLHIIEGASRGVWTAGEVGDMLHCRRVFPLASNAGVGLGTPADGLFWLDDCPDAPPAWLAGALMGSLVASPAASAVDVDRAWRLLLDAVHILPISVACRFRVVSLGETEEPELTLIARGLLPLAERYLCGRHPALHTDLSPNAPRLAGIRVFIATEVLVECALIASKPTAWSRDVAVVDQPDHDVALYVRVGLAGVPWPALCLGLARTVVPPGPNPRADAREGLATFLLSAHALVSGDATATQTRTEELCVALGLPAVPRDQAWDPLRVRTRQASPSAGLTDAPCDTRPRKGDAVGVPALDSHGSLLGGEAVKLEPADLDALSSSTHGGVTTRMWGTRWGLWSGASRKRARTEAEQNAHISYGEHGGGGTVGAAGWPDRHLQYRRQAEPKGSSKGATPEADRASHPLSMASQRSSAVRPSRAPELDGDLPEQVFTSSIVDLSTSAGLTEVRKAQPPLPETPAGSLSDEERLAVGRWGERFVYSYLLHVLSGPVRQRVRWVNQECESGREYDICIEDHTGAPLAFVEVKTTRKPGRHIFEVSHDEWNFAREKGSQYAIYRVFSAGCADVALTIIPDPHRQWHEHRIGICLTL